MDFGFAPGGSRDPTDEEHGQQERVRRMFQRRENTKLIDRPGGPKSTPIASVRGFIQHLTKTGSIAKPIGNALIGSHADDEGHLFIPMFPKQKGPTDFEILQDTIDKANHSIKLTAVINGPGDHEVHVKGCNIGGVTKFLAKLKEAFGSSGVTAPKHFHGLRVDLKIGVTEYMAYEFVIRSRTQITDRDALIAKFDAAKFKFIGPTDAPDDGPLVGDENWPKWVPADITTTGKNPSSQNFKFGGTVGGETERAFKRQFRVETTKKGDITWDFTPPAPFPPESGYLAALRADLKLADQFKSTPTFLAFQERLGYATVDEYVDGIDWKITRGKKSKSDTLFAVGTRWQYIAVIPIVEVATGFLITNFHPDSGSGFDPSIELVETDPRFFGGV
jgi:hypothetical protein